MFTASLPQHSAIDQHPVSHRRTACQFPTSTVLSPARQHAQSLLREAEQARTVIAGSLGFDLELLSALSEGLTSGNPDVCAVAMELYRLRCGRNFGGVQ